MKQKTLSKWLKLIVIVEGLVAPHQMDHFPVVEMPIQLVVRIGGITVGPEPGMQTMNMHSGIKRTTFLSLLGQHRAQDSL